MSAKQEEAEARRKAAQNKLRAAVDAVLKTEEGRTVFRYLHFMSGFDRSSIVADNRAHVEVEATLANEGRRSLYIDLRQHATKSLLLPVEEAAADRGPVDLDPPTPGETKP